MSPAKSSSSNWNRKWGFALILAFPLFLSLIALVVFQTFYPDSLLARSMLILFIVVLSIEVWWFVVRLPIAAADETTSQILRQMEATRRIAPGALTAEQIQEMQLFLPQKRSRFHTFLHTLGFILVGLVFYWLVVPEFPVMSGGWPNVSPLIVVLVGYATVEIVETIISNARAQNKPAPWRTVAVVIVGLLGAAIIFSAVIWLLGPWMQQNLLLIALLACAAIFAVLLLPICWDVLVGEYVRRPLRQLDYASALAHAAQVEKRIRSSTWKSIVLSYMGRPKEAEDTIRSSLAPFHRSLLIADSFIGWRQENLGYALLEQNRFEEAATAFEDALVFNPKDSDRLTALAQVYLRQGVEPERALDLTERSLKYKQHAVINRLFMRNSVGELRANRAWALALAGRYEEARATLEQAFREYDRSLKLSAASMHWRAGRVMTLRRDERAAHEHFARAAQIDPNGSYGRLARQALAEQG